MATQLALAKKHLQRMSEITNDKNSKKIQKLIADTEWIDSPFLYGTRFMGSSFDKIRAYFVLKMKTQHNIEIKPEFDMARYLSAVMDVMLKDLVQFSNSTWVIALSLNIIVGLLSFAGKDSTSYHGDYADLFSFLGPFVTLIVFIWSRCKLVGIVQRMEKHEQEPEPEKLEEKRGCGSFRRYCRTTMLQCLAFELWSARTLQSLAFMTSYGFVRTIFSSRFYDGRWGGQDHGLTFEDGVISCVVSVGTYLSEAYLLAITIPQLTVLFALPPYVDPEDLKLYHRVAAYIENYVEEKDLETAAKLLGMKKISLRTALESQKSASSTGEQKYPPNKESSESFDIEVSVPSMHVTNC